RAVARPLDLVRLAVDRDRGAELLLAVGDGRRLVVEQRDRAAGQVLGAERLPDLGGADLAALFVGADLDVLGELDLHAARQVERVAGLHHVGDAALGPLAIEPGYRRGRAA